MLFTMSTIETLLLFFLSRSISAYHYNEYPYNFNWKEAPRYPDYCCLLEWTNITQGQELPKDWIHAGKFMNRDFAFTRNIPNYFVAVK